MIETDRLMLRPITLDDYEDHHAMHSDPQQDFPSRQQSTREESWFRVLRNAGHWALLGYGNFVVTEKKTGQYLGETGLADYRRGMGDNAGLDEAAWYFTKSAQGNGFAFEAAEAVHDWYLKRTGRLKTFCMVDPENQPSISLARKLGYEPIRQGIYKDNPVIIFRRDAT